jgi:hypothetical protein
MAEEGPSWMMRGPQPWLTKLQSTIGGPHHGLGELSERAIVSQLLCPFPASPVFAVSSFIPSPAIPEPQGLPYSLPLNLFS